LRTTPWRALLLTGVAAADAKRLADGVTALGLIADPADHRLNIFACVGAPSCLSATVDARGDAARLAAIIGAVRDQTLHVSGCSKSCAHRGSASLTLVGRDGRYDLIRNGGAAGRPSLTGLNMDQIEALLQSAKGERR
jgi:sulfite reductase beta subunit-like hemoprotein